MRRVTGKFYDVCVRVERRMGIRKGSRGNVRVKVEGSVICNRKEFPMYIREKGKIRRRDSWECIDVENGHLPW